MAQKSKKYEDILRIYGYPFFKMGLAHMIDIGVRNAKEISDKDIEEMIEHEKNSRDPDAFYIITPRALGDICEVAREIAIRFKYEDLETLVNM